MRNLEKVKPALDEVIGVILARRERVSIAFGGPDCCVGAAAVAVEVLRHFGFEAKPLVVAAMVERRDAQVFLGFTGVDHGPEIADLHMVVMVDGHLLDLTIDQANLHNRAITMQPVFLESNSLPMNFGEESTEHGTEVDGHMLRYYSYPKDLSYLASEHWRERKMRGRVVKKIIEDLEESSPV